MTTGDSPSRERMPLAGVRVLDLSRILAGPFCTQLLADLGADVVKVERPGTGDDTREWGPPFVANDADGKRGPSGYFLSCNRGKRSLVLDLAKPESRAVLDDLLRTADAMIENFLPDTVAKLGLEPERLKQLNPRLVTCSISGYGRTGPLADMPGYDLAIQASSGLMSITGEPDGEPMKVGVAISDILTGLYAATSLLAGLFAREQGRTASGFDLALADCTLAALVNVAQSSLLTGRSPRRFGNAHPQIVPYESFPTADGHVVLAVGADRQWERFCLAVGQVEWSSDPRFRTNPDRVAHRDELSGLLRPLMQSRTTADWLQLLESAEVPHARIATVDEAAATPQSQFREMVQTLEDEAGRPLSLLGSPIHWSDRTAPKPTPPPDLGRHTDAILRDWLHYEDEHLARLREAGVIA